jgi:hypothetical protein
VCNESSNCNCSSSRVCDVIGVFPDPLSQAAARTCDVLFDPDQSTIEKLTSVALLAALFSI